ncbi:hypothetical protein E2C01_085168 [Portunus trituberculatus]|uniref:Uncharacterized protein n=1 Tax=Portunus trituberculatus TaxID=210409 RepID=A0A5B7JCU7_PORTR|nr:hypothetical protein [Portunus trituberculatus]
MTPSPHPHHISHAASSSLNQPRHLRQAAITASPSPRRATHTQRNKTSRQPRDNITLPLGSAPHHPSPQPHSAPGPGDERKIGPITVQILTNCRSAGRPTE